MSAASVTPSTPSTPSTPFHTAGAWRPTGTPPPPPVASPPRTWCELPDGLLRDLDAGDAELEASPSSSSPGDTATDADADRPPRPVLWSWICLILFVVKVAQCIRKGYGLAAPLRASFVGLPYALHILEASTRLSALLPRALRGVDSCAAQRIYVVLVYLATLATGINPFPGVLERRASKHAGDITILLGVALFQRPRSPALGAALSCCEVVAASLLRWHALACCGQATSAGQALVEVGQCAAVLTATHVAMWWYAPSTLPTETRAGRATKKLKAA
jgi:hypothetical protein